MAAALISCGAFVPLAVKWPLHTRHVSRITVKTLAISNIIPSVCLVGKGRLKERCGLEPRTNIFCLRNRQNVVRIRFRWGLDSRIYGISFPTPIVPLMVSLRNFSLLYFLTYLLQNSIWVASGLLEGCKGKGKVIPLQTRCGPESG